MKKYPVGVSFFTVVFSILQNEFIWKFLSYAAVTW